MNDKRAAPLLTRRQTALLAARSFTKAMLWLSLWPDTESVFFVRAAEGATKRHHNKEQTKKTIMTSPTTAHDPYRLPRHVIPSHYDLRIEPDLQSRSFTGHEVVALSVTEPTADIVLNAAELEISSALLSGEGSPPSEGTVQMDEDLQRCRITFSSVIPPGEWKLALTFRGTLNDKLRGFYRSTYKDAQGIMHHLAATQFEATDARRAFPCWDEPQFKAIFAVTLAIDPTLTAISNTRIVDDRQEGGKRVLRFAESMKMSTYLVAFIVGKLEATATIMAQQTPVRLWSVPGKQHLTPFGHEIAVYSLNFLADYYGIPYPGDKLDLIAIPDFASGAMENLGAITFRETALLLDQRTATHAEQGRIADVVAHENAHMWFGDLVTMAWWNGLWLNEAFATFMEMLVVDAWKPEWERWTAFGVARAAALSVDGLVSTRPIEFPVRAPKEAEAMFDVLTYEKGASVLRMLEQHIGPTVFRDGVRRYLTTHAYGNAETTDLWVSLGQAAKQDVPTLMNEWIFSSGYPLVSLQVDSLSTLKLTQRRFTYAKDAATTSSGASAQQWQVPIQLRITTPNGSETQRVLLSDRESLVSLPTNWTSVLANEGGHGFYRVRYSRDLLAKLQQTGLHHLAPVERFNLLNDTWASTIAGMVSPADYLALTEHFKDERDPHVWAVLLGSCSTINHLLSEEDRPLLAAFVRDRVAPTFQDLGWSPHEEERDLVRELRGDIIRALGTLGRDQEIQAQASEAYAAWHQQARQIDPNIIPALISILAFTGNQARYDEFFDRFRKATTPQEERRYLFSLAAFRKPELLERTLTKTLTDEIRTQDAPFLVSALLHNVYIREQAWEFVKGNWERMDRLFPKSGLRRMCGGIVGLSTPELEQDVRAFFASRKIDLGGKTLEQYLEQLHVAVLFRERDRGAIRDVLTRVTT
ncbi:MAG: Membrane alanine aminopeptidase N [Nitrospira sp.]|jgi:puromycin-sensitive aminopeptidase|nr:MAG: Membrane alanine aminopeptidase N [Nitrospira sp.]